MSLPAPPLVPDSRLVGRLHPSPNVEPRRGCSRPDILLLHYTGMRSCEKAIGWLADPRSKVSCHYVVDCDGTVVQMVAEALRAWHAGVASWGGVRDVNSHSIGIEIHNPGHDQGYPEFPEAQMAAVTALCRDIVARNAIPPERVLAHSDVAPARKIDPGEKLDWARLWAAGVGHWVQPAPLRMSTKADPTVAALPAGAADTQRARHLLAAYGYGLAPDADAAEVATVVRAFQRHFRPARVDGTVDASTLDTLERLAAAVPGGALPAARSAPGHGLTLSRETPSAVAVRRAVLSAAPSRDHAGPSAAPHTPRIRPSMPAASSPSSAAARARFFAAPLADADPELAGTIDRELGRQRHEIELIASENIVSRAVLEAAGSVMTNKYAEGYPGKRYYGGCQYVDEAETLAIDRAKRLFGAGFANVQPSSGSQMNQAVFLALLKPGDTFMGLDLAAGGHLTHGSPVNMSGKWFKVVPYGVRRDDQRIDMDDVARLARESRPKLILAGGTAYSRLWDWRRFREIADEVGAFLMVDMAHIAGLVAGGVHPSPVPHAHVVTSTTHKSLRGPRGGLILTNDEEIAKKVNSAVFPGLQGGPLMHIVAAKAVAFGEALRPEFKDYAKAVVDNARVLAETVKAGGYDIVAGGTDNHLMLVDLRPKGLTGKASEIGLGRAHITCNKNGVPFDTRSPFVTSGIRLGTPAATTRGFAEAEFRDVGRMIVDVLDGLARNGDQGDGQIENRIREEATALCKRFPIY